MATTKADFDKVLGDIDTETTRIGVKFEEILAKLAAGGMSSEDEAATLASGARLVENLKKIGADPADPVPVPDPEPNPTPDPEGRSAVKDHRGGRN